MYKEIKTQEEIKEVAKLAHEIWSNHYHLKFSEKDLNDLINAVQSERAITNKINDNYVYSFILDNDNKAGYFAYTINKEKNELFLCKFYILKSYRGKGLGRKTIQYLEDVAKKNKVAKLTLTVYEKNLSSIEIYKSMGFENLGLIFRKINNNLTFNDYKMSKFI